MIRPTGWGVCISPQEANTHGPWVAEQALKLLKPAWYANWDVDPVAPASDTAFVPMVWGPAPARAGSSPPTPTAWLTGPKQPCARWTLRHRRCH